MQLIPTTITTTEQVEAMRQIFNECLEFMTKPVPWMSHWDQFRWWRELPAKVKRFKAFTYATAEDPTKIIAYSLLQWKEDGRLTPLFGIARDARGQNIARQIIRHYLKEADGPLIGEERSDHKAIIKMNREAGWLLICECAGVRYLYHPNDKRSYPDYQGMIEYWSAP